MVSVTLHTLADLVPKLGSESVIGGKRGKLFNDGRPITHCHQFSARKTRRNSKKPNEIVITALPERPRPDGEETGENSTEDTEEQIDEEDFDNWGDWEAGENQNVDVSILNSLVVEDDSLGTEEIRAATNVEIGIRDNGKTIPDITQLDIKCQTDEQNEEFDFFQDMEPVIETPSKYVVSVESGSVAITSSQLNLNMSAEDASKEDGWVDEEWD